MKTYTPQTSPGPLAPLALAIALTLTACRTHTPAALPAPSRNREQYIRQQYADTLILHDSIYVERRGDTLRIEKYHTRWRERILRDSIHHTDTLHIPYPVEHTRTVARPLSRWQRLVQAVGYLTLAAAAAALIRRLRR